MTKKIYNIFNYSTIGIVFVLLVLAFMLLWNPKLLWYDAGFQLSFLAVIGLMEFGPMLKTFALFLPEALGIREAFQMTIAAQIAAIPIIIMLFGRLSLIAPVANVLVAPAIPLAMLFGFMGTMVSFVNLVVGLCISYIAWGFLQWIIFIATTLSDMPLASIAITEVHWLFILLYYCGIVWWIRWKTKPVR